MKRLYTQAPDELPDVRIDRRTRICIAIIVIGLANFMLYSLGYVFLGGDAINGRIETRLVNAQPVVQHYLASKGERIEVSRAVWLYSAIHSTTIWLTVGAVLLSMLTLAKERIVSSMRSSIVRGRTFITMLATIVALISIMVTAWFVLAMARQLLKPLEPGLP